MVSRKERQKGWFLLLVWATVVLSAGCTNQRGKEDGVDANRSGAALSFDYRGGSDVIGFLFEVFICDERTQVVEEVLDLQDQLAPGGLSLLGLLDAGSGHIMADMFVPLDPGCYDIAVTPIQSLDAETGETVASEDCSAAFRQGVIIEEGETTEVDPPLVSQCESDGPGGLDVPVVLNHEPTIEILIQDKFEFECDVFEVCARVIDPDNDPMEIVWASLVEGEILRDEDGEPILGPDIISEISQPLSEIGEEDGILEYEECITFTITAPGTFHFIALVYDLLSDGTRIEDALADLGTDAVESHESFSFPLHVTLGGEECCLPTTDRVCGEDGNAYYLDSCGEIAELAESCPGDCADGECRCVVYTSVVGDNDNDGHSWQSAKLDVQEAIDTAELEGGCEVWVREGTYTPVPIDGTIQLKSNVDVYGGFDGYETIRSGRDFVSNHTVLSGEDTSDHVVTGADSAILDGFTIQGGNNDWGSPYPFSAENCGAGMLIDGVSPVIRNCIFTDNNSEGGGGAMCIFNGSPQIENCHFHDNTAELVPAGVYISGGATRIVDSVFEDMMVHGGPSGGAALSVHDGALEIVGSRFVNNSSKIINSYHPGAVAIFTDDTVTITDCTFEGNTSRNGGGAISARSAASLIIRDSDFIENYTDIGGGGAIYVEGTDTYIVGCRFAENGELSDGGGAIRNTGGVLTVVNSVFESNYSRYKGSAIANTSRGSAATSLNASNCTFVLNIAESRRGSGGTIYNEENSIANVANSIFYDNTAPESLDVTPNVTVSHSIVLPPYTCQANCVQADPQFVDYAGGDYTPQNAVCIDTADETLLPYDEADIDDDGIVLEPVPLDYLGNARIMGGGLDMGAIETE